LPIEFQGLQDHIETDLIPVFEAVGQGLLWTVNFHRDAVYVLLFNPFRESSTAEPENAQWRIIEPGRFSAPRQGKINLMGNFGGQLMIGKGRNEADNTFRGPFAL
jgi:hypothetical protein